MPKTVRITKSSIDKLIDIAGKMPPKEPSDYGLRETINNLMPTIKTLQDKGYNLGEISKLLSEHQVPISTGTLKQYVSEFTKIATPKSAESKQRKSMKKPNQEQSTIQTSSVANVEQPQQLEQVKTNQSKAEMSPVVEVKKSAVSTLNTSSGFTVEKDDPNV